MTVAERLAPMARSIAEPVAHRLRRDVPALGQDAAEAVEQVIDTVAKAAEDLAKTIEHATESKKEPRTLVHELGDTASGAVGSVASAAGEAAARVGDAAARAGRDLKIDERVEDVVSRIRSELPTDRITTLVTKLERELPGTDKDRYDRAYLRGWTRARTTFVGIGVLTGIVAGVAGAILLDPKRGPERRAALGARARKLGTTIAREARGRATWTADRARGIAIERGLITPAGATAEPDGHTDTEVPFMQATPEVPATADAASMPAERVPVMDPGVSSGASQAAASPDRDGDVEPVMPLADGPVTDPASIEREPMTTPEGGVIGGVAAPEPAVPEPSGEAIPEYADDDARLPANTSAVTSTLEPEAENATLTGDDADRGTWHRNL